MPVLKKVCPKCSCTMHVRKSKCSYGYCFSTKPRLLLKPENAMKSSESHKNCLAECQACKRALENVYQSQECRMAMPIKKTFETPEESWRCKQAEVKCQS